MERSGGFGVLSLLVLGPGVKEKGLVGAAAERELLRESGGDCRHCLG